MWLNVFISKENTKREYERFEQLVNKYYLGLNAYDFDYLDRDGFLEFIPKSDQYAQDRGMAILLWNRYIRKSTCIKEPKGVRLY